LLAVVRGFDVVDLVDLVVELFVDRDEDEAERLRDAAGFALPSRAERRFSIAASRSSIPSSPEIVLPARSFSWFPFWRAERAAGLLAIRATASSPTDWSCESTDLFVAIGLNIRHEEGFKTIDIRQHQS
jgi:hypothetical protein